MVEIITVLQPPTTKESLKMGIYGSLHFYFQLHTYQINGNGIFTHVILDKVLFR